MFERRWMLRDLIKYAGMPVNHWLGTLSNPERLLETRQAGQIAELNPPVDQQAALLVGAGLG